jgi:hypothetical protein
MSGRRLGLAIVVAGWWCAAPAFAQTARPVVMPVPLEVKSPAGTVTEADRERLSREFRRLLKLAGTAAPDLALAESATTELSAARCGTDDRCVSAFAMKSGALYALFVSLERRADGSVVATGRVVRDDAVVARQPRTVTRSPGPFVDVARAAFTELFGALDVGALPPERVIEKPVTVVVPPPVEVTAPPPPTVTVAPRGVGLLVAGGATALAGLITLAVTSVPALSARSVGTPPVAASQQDANGLFIGYVGSIVGFSLVGVGAVLGVIGGVSWATSGGPRVSVQPLSGGALLSWGGAW